MADGDAWGDEDIGGDPCALTDGDGHGDEGTGLEFEFVGCAAEVGVLGDDDALFKCDSFDAVAIDIVGDGGAVAHGEVPGGPNFGSWVDAGGGVEVGSEGAEEEVSPAVAGAGAKAEEGGLDDGPECSEKAVFEGVGA